MFFFFFLNRQYTRHFIFLNENLSVGGNCPSPAAPNKICTQIEKLKYVRPSEAGEFKKSVNDDLPNISRPSDPLIRWVCPPRSAFSLADTNRRSPVFRAVQY